MKTMRVFVPMIVLAIGLLAYEALDASAPPSEPRIKNLMRMPLDEEFTPGREILVDLVEIPPKTALERHRHPGEEFHYYLEGDAEIEIDGEPTIKGTPGTVGHVPFKRLHKAIAGAKGAKVLVFRVHTKGEPMRYLEKEEGTRE